MQKVLLGLVTLLLVLGLHACFSSPSPQTLTVAIASSLADVMTAVRSEFVAQNPQITIQFNTGSSGTLQQQIEQQAPIDVFASAAVKPIQELQNKGLIDGSQVKIFAKNELVLVQSQQSKIQLKTLADLANSQVQKIALGNPKTVPAGKYAENALQKSSDLYQSLKNENKLVFGENVRQVLTYIHNQDVDAGFVYRTDILNQADLRVVERFSEQVTEPILYAIAPIKSSKYPAASQQLIEFILGETGQQILQKYGFLAPRD